MSLSQKLKLLRAEHNMTQEQLAAQINVARATISGYETRNRQPSHEKLTSIAETFHVSVDYLLDNEESFPAAEFSLLQERLLDEEVFTLYKDLSRTSKEDIYKHVRLLTLWENQKRYLLP
ncbi:MAG: helix-turn-helix transcriptional regulator [Dorea sp.]|jgi:transcriptional regulator with XRE-family HTH domain|nr:helix-turn-helix transcriptional regulator [Dorea sp.]MCI9271957.1 helix-turn-helix transcriptional regulator [Dorea sp.]